MMKTAILPLLLSAAVYVVFSVRNPISHVDEALMQRFEEAFRLSLWAFVPAVFMLLLPLLKVSVLYSMAASVLSGIMVACLIQKVPLLEVLKICVLGYHADGDGLGAILNGGGLVSMLEIAVILLISMLFARALRRLDCHFFLQKLSCCRRIRFVWMMRRRPSLNA